MKIAIVTLGCKTNEYESQKIGQELSEKGFDVNFGLVNADLYILNTCSVTHKADSKSRQLVARALAKNKDGKVVVCGCGSEHDRSYFEKHESVIKIFGTKDKEQIVRCITEIAPPAGLCESGKKSKTRKLIKIGDGCDNFCTYCIVPILRGRASSRSIDEIVFEIENSKEQEVVLTAINLNQFEPGLPVLFKHLEGVNKRVRLGSLEPQMITKELIEAFKRLKKPCGHFHLSVQSGSTATLKAMNRKYNGEEVAAAVKLLRENFEDAYIACDVIAGFPEESDADFEESLKTLEKCEFSHMHIFPFSLRKGTAAEKLKPVPQQKIKERVVRLTEAAKKSEEKFLNSLIGKTGELLVEAQKDGFSTGHTENYIKCFLPGNFKSGEIVNVTFRSRKMDGIVVDKI